jgi:hypothetical protein
MFSRLPGTRSLHSEWLSYLFFLALIGSTFLI